MPSPAASPPHRPRRPGAGLVLLLLLTALAGCAAPATLRRRPAPPIPPPAGASELASIALVPDADLQALLDPYPNPDGPSWLGGDVASSIRLAADRWVWIFGDTLLGGVGADCAGGRSYCERRVSGAGAGMIANSAGTMVRSPDGSFYPVVKYWRSEDGAPAPIFVSPEEGFLWPLAGTRVGTVLLIAANRHTFASGLEPVGNVLLRVWNPDAPPDAWLYDAHEVPGFLTAASGRPPLSWTAALVEAGEWVHLLGSRDVGPEADTVLARLPVGGLDRAGWQPRLEYLLRADGEAEPPIWSSDLDAERLHAIEGLPGTSETNIDFAPGIGWYSFRIPALRYEIRLYTASDLLGPWRDAGVVYRIPAPWSTTTRGPCPSPPELETPPAEVDPACERVFAAYAAKSHPALVPPGEHAVSYNVNVWSGGLDAAVHALETMPAFYVPQMLSSE